MTDEYDVVVVGAGIVGSIIAKEAAEAGMSVLVLEAGTDLARTFEGYQQQLETFYGAFFKTPEGPYAFNPDAPQPDIPGIATPGADYFVETGTQKYGSTYARAAGGTTLHWLGTCLRMLAADQPNVEGARETARRTIRASNRAAEAVSRLRTLFTEKK